MIKLNMFLDEYEDLQDHPHNQYPLEIVQFIYHIWLKVVKSAAWRVDFAVAIPNYSMKQKCLKELELFPIASETYLTKCTTRVMIVGGLYI